jgi:hypothetical protein
MINRRMVIKVMRAKMKTAVMLIGVFSSGAKAGALSGASLTFIGVDVNS